MGHNAYTTPWTDEAVEYLRRRVAEGWTSGCISRGLRNDLGLIISASAVVGKTNRDGIELVANTWPEAAIEIMRRMAWNDASAPEIAKELQANGFTFTPRNVRDRARIAKIPLAAAIRQRKKPSLERASAKMISDRAATTQRLRLLQQRCDAAEAWEDRESDPLPSSHPANLIDLKSHQCKWPLGRNADGIRLFCGAFKLGKMSYCTHHHKLSTTVKQQPTEITYGQKEKIAG